MTLDQAKVIMELVDVLMNKNNKTTVALTAARGRGKSAAIGLGIAAAIKLGYSSIFVTAPSPLNLKTLFEFVGKGLELLGYKERMDF
jgi:N-acetyltransferase 10